MSSLRDGVYTMSLSVIDGQLTFADDVYDSKDESTSVFMSIITFGYFLLFGLLCVNLLIALISKRYDMMRDNKNRDWKFAQFELLIGYCATHPQDGLPFFFPFSLLYIPYTLIYRLICCCKKEKSSSVPLQDDQARIDLTKIILERVRILEAEREKKENDD